jgi:carbamoyltransferase
MIAGISFGYHDSAACVIDENKVFFASQEERYSRKKFDAGFPSLVLSEIDDLVGFENIENFVLHEKPLIKFERQVSQLFSGGYRDFQSFPENVAALRKVLDWRKKKISDTISKISDDKFKISEDQIKFSEHHLSHAAAAFFTSPFEESIVFVLDAVGEWDSQSVWIGSGNKLNKIYAQNFPNSIGLFYSAMTYFLGFKVNSGEFKLMGLAPYGEPRFVDKIKEIVTVSEFGQVRLDLSKFSFISGSTMTDERMEKFFNKKRRLASDPLSQWHADMAASVQVVLEGALDKLISYFISATNNPKKICLGGGVALNCVANKKIADKFGWENLHIFPASGDSGGSVGAALAYASTNPARKNAKTTKRWSFNGSLLGSEPDRTKCKYELDALDLQYEELNRTDLTTAIANGLADGLIVAIYHGRAEFGPRALGNRTILADPRISKGQITLNEKIKFRESFRPFAPVVMEELADSWFEISSPERFMLRTTMVKNFSFNYEPPIVNSLEYNSPIDIEERLNYMKSPIPSVTHLDGSARIQTVPVNDKRLIREILEQFYMLTGCPVLVNTSFNVRGEPIVHSPYDALRCFLSTGIDLLCLNDFMIDKKQQSKVNFAHGIDSAVSED